MNLNNYFASNYQQKKVVVATVSVVVSLTQNVGNGPEAVAGEALQEPEHEEGDVVGGEGGQQPRHQAHLQYSTVQYSTVQYSKV